MTDDTKAGRGVRRATRVPQGGSLPVREVRVRPEYAELYPELAVGAWVPAREFAEVMVLRARTARSLRLQRRTLDQRHFEFRGGPPEARPRRARTRRTD